MLIAKAFPLDATALRTEIDAVFTRRATHKAPGGLPPPPPNCRVPYRRLAITVGLEPDTGTGHAAAAMLDPVLGRDVTSDYWSPDSQAWISR